MCNSVNKYLCNEVVFVYMVDELGFQLVLW